MPRLTPKPSAAIGAGRVGTVRLADVIAALTYALDLTEGQRPGHTLRSTLLAMRLGEAAGLGRAELEALYYAALLKDSGCSSNAARMSALFGSPDQELKRNMRLVDWHDRWTLAMRTARSCGVGLNPVHRIRHFLMVAQTPTLTRDIIQTRCERGAQIAQVLGFPAATSEAILYVDEHWCGLGHPFGIAGEEIPLMSRIILLAQTVEAFWSEQGTKAAMEMARKRRGTWFDPTMVDHLLAFRRDAAWWSQLADSERLGESVVALEPGSAPLVATDERLDRIAFAFAAVIDAKTPFTARHSTNVARYAVGIAGALGVDGAGSRDMLRAGLLHDIGKLGVSNRILDKPDKLTDDEFAEIRKHPAWTLEILDHVSAFRHFAPDAARHHERLDGRGYPWRVGGEQLSFTARVLAVADVYEALTANRPYRDGLPVATVVDIMARDRGTAFDPQVFEAAVGLAETGIFASLATVTEDGFEQLQEVIPVQSIDSRSHRVA
ncbi:HD-GYP domain-containing protein [Gemmatimonas phototrophica]|uniref:HD-GYP domain-containing protein n=1 Tax=Gemmatimonas phototrophica TaxID=1379270 RepID=UPI0011AE98D4|nr:HD-GYP domain-containing protein [Gemmatimonas phototrophica]